MSNELISTQSTIFNFKSNQVRTITQDDKLWFVAKDVCKALNIAWHGKIFSAFPKEWQGMRKFLTPSGQQNFKIITEPAVYKLAFRSNKSEADEFTNWVAEEVLPSIRQTGKFESQALQDFNLSTTDQRRPLDKLIKVWVNLGKISYRFAWTQVNSHFNLNSISELPTEWLPEAIAFVEEQIQAVQNLKLEESHTLALEVRKHRISEAEKTELLESLKKERDQTCASRERELLRTSSNNLKKITNELYKEYSREVLPNTTISTDPIIYALHHQYHEAEELARKSTMELYHAYNTAISVVLAL